MNPETILNQQIRARYPLIGIVSHEETRVMASIRKVAREMRLMNGSPIPCRVVEWAITTGMTGIEGEDPAAYQDPNSVLNFIAEFDQDEREERTIFVLKDLHRVMENELRVVRFLRDVVVRFEIRKHNLILLSPTLQVPTDIEKQISLIDWPLPDSLELTSILNQVEADLPADLNKLNGNREQIIQAMSGLTFVEAANVLSAGVVACGELGDGILSHIISEKKQIIRKSGILEYFEATVTMKDIGGLDNLKTYASMKRNAMSAKARAAGVDCPKGVLLVGVPGTGKSLSAKAIAGGQLPLLRLDVGKLLGGGRVGEAEGNISSALKIAEAVAPCVLWIDEIEKALADNGGASDGGVMMRVLGSLLTWMQETTSPVYTVATANSVNLKPELLSRFDDVMFVDLPDARSREEILNVHLAKRNVKVKRKAGDVDIQPVIDAMWGFSGREIEKVVKFAVERAFFNGCPVTANGLLESAKAIVPTSETKADEIKALREWSKNKAIPAGRPLETRVVNTQVSKNIDI